MSFASKVVLITGGSSGIGAATAVLFAKEEASVVIVGRNEEKLTAAAEECGKVGKKPHVIKADVSIDDDAKRIVQETIDKFGKLDVLVNNAGIVRLGSILSKEILKNYDEVERTNVRAVINITSLAAPHLCKTKGNIVNVSSVASMKIPKPKFLPYSISKAALDVFTRGAATELGPFGVRVNSVNCGPTKTEVFINSGHPPPTWDYLASITALRRVSEPEEVAELIMFLASDKAKGITGSLVVNDNGFFLL